MEWSEITHRDLFAERTEFDFGRFTWIDKDSSWRSTDRYRTSDQKPRIGLRFETKLVSPVTFPLSLLSLAKSIPSLQCYSRHLASERRSSQLRISQTSPSGRSSRTSNDRSLDQTRLDGCRDERTRHPHGSSVPFEVGVHWCRRKESTRYQCRETDGWTNEDWGRVFQESSGI